MHTDVDDYTAGPPHLRSRLHTALVQSMRWPRRICLVAGGSAIIESISFDRTDRVALPGGLSLKYSSRGLTPELVSDVYANLGRIASTVFAPSLVSSRAGRVLADRIEKADDESQSPPKLNRLGLRGFASFRRGRRRRHPSLGAHAVLKEVLFENLVEDRRSWPHRTRDLQTVGPTAIVTHMQSTPLGLAHA